MCASEMNDPGVGLFCTQDGWRYRIRHHVRTQIRSPSRPGRREYLSSFAILPDPLESPVCGERGYGNLSQSDISHPTLPVISDWFKLQ